MAEPWEQAISACRRARIYHQAFTIAAKEVELDAIAQLKDAGFGVREIARLTQIPRSTVSRLSRDLVTAGRQVAIERTELDPELLESTRKTIRNTG